MFLYILCCESLATSNKDLNINQDRLSARSTHRFSLSKLSKIEDCLENFSYQNIFFSFTFTKLLSTTINLFLVFTQFNFGLLALLQQVSSAIQQKQLPKQILWVLSWIRKIQFQLPIFCQTMNQLASHGCPYACNDAYKASRPRSFIVSSSLIFTLSRQSFSVPPRDGTVLQQYQLVCMQIFL